jgi:hypothetical protein
MIRLIVMYNLPGDADETQFLDWRLGAHQQSNAALPQMLNTDFGRIVGAWPKDAIPRFRFYESDVQAGLRENIKKLGDFEYSISEILTSSDDIGVKHS